MSNPVTLPVMIIFFGSNLFEWLQPEKREKIIRLKKNIVEIFMELRSQTNLMIYYVSFRFISSYDFKSLI
jgi:hypothetical protein